MRWCFAVAWLLLQSAAEDFEDLRLDEGALPSHAACAILDFVARLGEGDCKRACAARRGATCDAVNWTGEGCALLQCGDARRATALGAAKVWRRRVRVATPLEDVPSRARGRAERISTGSAQSRSAARRASRHAF